FSSQSLFGSAAVITRAADSDATFRFDDVLVGAFQLNGRDPVTNRAATASGVIASEGEVVTRDLHLAAFGSVTGTVRRADGMTPVSGAQVTLSSGLQATTDLNGQYEVPILPLGSLTITVSDPPTRGVGRSTGALTTQGQVAVIDVQLLGQGTVIGTVTDAAGLPIAGASFSVFATASGFGDSQSGTTGADGTVQIERVLAGTMTISASAGGLNGTLPPRELAANEVAHVTVMLEPTARINGSVFAPDGQTPVASGTAKVLVFSPYYYRWVEYRSMPLGTNGSFNFDGLPTSQTYQLQMFDARGLLRAFVNDEIRLTAGALETRDLTFVAMGTVRGRVINPDGSPAPDYSVQVRSLNPDFGRYGADTSDAAGFYEVTDLAVGNIAVSTGNAGLGLLGEAFGSLSADGEVLTRDVLLVGNAITLPLNLYDANNAPYQLQPGGDLVGGLGNPFYGTDASGASILEVIAGGTPTRFTGGAIGTAEGQQQEIATRQQDLAGLNITRKVFVPSDGYFARYLELLNNPTDAPITVDLRVTTNIASNSPVSSVVATSSGDTTLSVADPATADRWVVIDDSDLDPFVAGGIAALTFAYDGVGAAEHPSSAAFTTTMFCQYYGCYPTNHLSYTWSQIVVPPHDTVAYLHFLAQENNRAGALVAAERLDQLAPEALVGLDADEIAAIRNFAVPANGVSTVTPLPPLNGTVTGRVLEYDGSTLVPYGQVYVQSDNALFHRRYYGNADGSGVFSIASNPGSYYYDKVLIPADSFTLVATHNPSGVLSPITAGQFVGTDTVASADVVFSNTGFVTGHVRTGNGGVATTGTVVMTGGVFLYAYVQADGSFTYTGVPPGAKSLIVSIPDPQGSGVQATASLTSIAGQTVVADLQLPATGAVSGFIRTAAGSPAVSVTVSIRNASQTINRYAYTDSSGHYTLSNLPIGAYTMSVTESRTGLESAANVTIVADSTIAQDLTLVGLGTLRIQVNLASGAPAPGTTVQINRPVYSAAFNSAGTTDANGLLVVANFPTTAFIIRALHPQNTNASVDVSGTLTTEGQVLPVTVTLPGLGSIAGQVTYVGGAIAASAPVRLYLGAATSVLASTTTDASGNYRFNNLVLGTAYRVRAINPVQTIQFKEAANVVLSAPGDLAVNVTLPAQAAVRVTVRRTDGTPVTSGYVRITDSFGTSLDYAINASGIALAPIVGEGAFTALPESIFGQPAGIAVQGVVTAADHGQTIDITVIAGVVLPTNLFDGNGYRFDIQSNGSVLDGTSDAYDGAASLTLFSGSQQFFNGQAFATPEDNGREIAITAPNNQLTYGLSLRRKIYVPAEGYFARYLEFLTNPGTTPITIDVGVISSLGSNFSTRVVATSNGDSFFSAGDTWLVTDDDYLDTPSGDPSLAFVVAGPGAARAPTVEQLFGNDNLLVRWNGVTVQPGQTVAFAHFLVQQPKKTSAIAAAQRLAQLPPEAMAGLSAEERSQILNWAVPADGSSPLISIGTAAERTAVVSGRALAGDGTTPVRNASVVYTSPNYPFLTAATRTVSADVNGQFTVTSAFAGDFTL
ncbi:MAG: carboxypeptidase-like regulatory domain-containing protein, partial [Vicinamibacterales bacterium]